MKGARIHDILSQSHSYPSNRRAMIRMGWVASKGNGPDQYEVSVLMDASRIKGAQFND